MLKTIMAVLAALAVCPANANTVTRFGDDGATTLPPTAPAAVAATKVAATTTCVEPTQPAAPYQEPQKVTAESKTVNNYYHNSYHYNSAPASRNERRSGNRSGRSSRHRTYGQSVNYSGPSNGVIRHNTEALNWNTKALNANTQATRRNTSAMGELSADLVAYAKFNGSVPRSSGTDQTPPKVNVTEQPTAATRTYTFVITPGMIIAGVILLVTMVVLAIASSRR